jgi:hypothetical protein
MTSKIYKNFGGGGKKLTRKNRKYLMKLYKKNRTRKNRTRKHRGGVGKPRTVCWDKIYWHDLNLICDEAITQLRTKYGTEEENQEATKLEKLKVHKMAEANRDLNIQLVRQLKLLTKKVGNNAYEITLTKEQNEFLNQFCTDTPCCVISGGGKFDDSDGLVRLYKTTEDLTEAQEEAIKDDIIVVQKYKIHFFYRNQDTGKVEPIEKWLSKEEFGREYAKMRLSHVEKAERERLKLGKTMMNTVATKEVNDDWGLFEAAGELINIEPIRMFTGNFHHTRPTGRVAFSDETQDNDGKVSPTKRGGGKELPTFKSTKTKLKQILEKVKPDNEYYDFSQKLNQELNKIKEKKFNEFVNKIYKNFDKIMSIPIKQKGGMPRRTRRSIRGDPLDCPICFDPLTDPSEIGRILECSGEQGQHKVHERCIREGGVNRCPMCRHEDTYLDAYGKPILFNPVQGQIYDMAEIVEGRLGPPDMGMHEYHHLIRARRIRALRDRAIAVRERVRENINLYWGSFMFLFTCHSLGAAWRGQYSSNYLTVIAMFYGSVIAVGLWPETPGSVSMTDQLVELIVRIMTFLDDMPGGMANAGGGKKTRRKRYKRKKRTKRKMRKKRGGMKIGDRVEKAFEMEGFNEETGKPTGKKFYQNYKGIIEKISIKKKKSMLTIKWSDGSTTTEPENDVKNVEPRIDHDKYQAEVPSYIQSSTNVRDSMPLSMEYMHEKPSGEMTPAQRLNTDFQNKPTGHLTNSKAAKALIKKLNSDE